MWSEAAVVRIAELEAQVERLSELEEENAALREALKEGAARNTEQEAELAEFAAQLELLRERLGQDSSNSHKPPSSDGPGAAGRNGRSKKSKSGRNRGGQKGRRGARREMFEPGEVNKLVHLFPETCCGCGHELPETPDIDARRHQMVDWVSGGRHITEWRRHEVRCDRCGALTRAEYDPDVIPSSPFGPRLSAAVVLLTGGYRMSRRNAAKLLSEFFRIEVSLGAVSNIEARATPALKPATDEAERQVDDAAVKYADATAWLLAGLTLSLWTFASKAATVFRIFEDGKRKTIRPLFGKLLGVLVTDRASVFGFWAMAMRQVCWAHLARRFVAFSQRAGPAGTLGRELVAGTKLLFEYWHAFVDGTLSREGLQTWMDPVQRHMEESLQRAVDADIPRLSGSCADILAHREALWTFVTHEGVDPTNNHAERELRAFVLWRKNSYGCQSERGLRFAERVMTVVHTARKQGVNVLDFLTRTLTAHHDKTTPPALFADGAAAA